MNGNESRKRAAGTPASANRKESGIRPRTETLLEYGQGRLQSLIEATGFAGQQEAIRGVFELLMGPAARHRCADGAAWPSYVVEDKTPFELSVAFDRSPSLRILVEPLADPPSLAGNAQLAREIIGQLADPFELDLSRVNRVWDLFVPGNPQGIFSVWLAAGVQEGRDPEFKVYFNPHAHGAGRAAAVVEEALTRLGFSESWPLLARTALRRGIPLDELKFFSLDLGRSKHARVKVYARHYHVTAQDLDVAAGACPAAVPGDVGEFLRHLSPGPASTFDGPGISTCLAFVEGTAAPVHATTHFPIMGYAADDGEIRDRVARCLSHYGLSATDYERVIAAHADRPLGSGLGLQSYVSFRREHGAPRVTVYFPIEAYAPGTVDPGSGATVPTSLEGVVEHFESASIAYHPFLQRLAREPVSLPHLWCLLSNFQMSISKNFARLLQAFVPRVADERVRGLLQVQLDDELGGSDPERAHTRLFATMMDQLARFRPDGDEARLFVAGRNLTGVLESIYEAEDVSSVLGAIMAGEVLGMQMDQFIGDQFRRQREVDPSTLEWLVLHEQLEVEHADSSREIARLLPDTALPAVWRGATAIANAGNRFLDDMYETCFVPARR